MRLVSLALLLSLLFFVSQAYKPVIFMHGINGHGSDFDPVVKYITETHPGTKVFPLKIVEGAPSIFHPLEYQLEAMRAEVERLKRENNFSEHHLVCHSQGGVICRGYLESQANHTVAHFLSLQSPQLGQFGLTGALEKYLPFVRNVTREEVYKLFYVPQVALHNAVSSYWRDPFHYKEYLKLNSFLANYNNETGSSQAAHSRANFLRVKKAIFSASTNDEVIEPALSAIFNFWRIQQDGLVKYEMLTMKQQDIYIKDSFGLKSLDERGDLVIQVDDQAKHMDWVQSRRVYDRYIEKWLD